jgi:hypothetical protein
MKKQKNAKKTKGCINGEKKTMGLSWALESFNGHKNTLPWWIELLGKERID